MFRVCFGRRVRREVVDEGFEDQINDLSSRNIRSFSFASLEMATNSFSRDMIIGEGGSARIYKGVLPDGTVAAIKKYKEAKPRKQQDFLHMVELMSHIRHRNINRVIGCCMEKGHRLIVSELAENGSVADLLQDPVKKESVFKWYKRAAICIGIARGLSYLHEDVHPRVIHRDIKPSNILLDSDLAPKIADFDIVNLLDDADDGMSHTTSTVIMGTAAYMAPEYLVSGRYTDKVDVYAFGMVMLEIISGRKAIRRDLDDDDDRFIIGWASKLSNQGRLREIVDPVLLTDFPFDEAQRFIEVALSCTQIEPHQRPQMHEVVLMLHGVCNSCSQALRKYSISMSDDGSNSSAPKYRVVGASTAETAATQDGHSSILQDEGILTWTDDNESASAPAVSFIMGQGSKQPDVMALVGNLMTAPNNISESQVVAFADNGTATSDDKSHFHSGSGSSSMLQTAGGLDVTAHVGDLITALNNILRIQGVEVSIVREHTDSAKVQVNRAIGLPIEPKEAKDGELNETIPVKNDDIESCAAQEHSEEQIHVATDMDTEIRRSSQQQENRMKKKVKPGIILSGSDDIVERLSQTMVFNKHSRHVCMEAVYPPFLTGVYQRKGSTSFSASLLFRHYALGLIMSPKIIFRSCVGNIYIYKICFLFIGKKNLLFFTLYFISASF